MAETAAPVAQPANDTALSPESRLHVNFVFPLLAGALGIFALLLCPTELSSAAILSYTTEFGNLAKFNWGLLVLNGIMIAFAMLVVMFQNHCNTKVLLEEIQKARA